MIAFEVVDTLGRKETRLGTSERGIRMQWKKEQKLCAGFGMRPVEIVSIRDIIKTAHEMAAAAIAAKEE